MRYGKIEEFTLVISASRWYSANDFLVRTLSFGSWSVVMFVPTVGTEVEVISISSFPFNFFSSSVFPEPVGPRQTQVGKTG